jgi:signal transduction histidine kinase/CheY-like chemotaxis protein/HAMP domain-containing protein
VTLKRRLQLNIALSLLTAGVVCLVLGLSLYRLERANQDSRIAGEIMTCLLEQVTLRNDYVRNGSARAREQWAGKQEQLNGLLASMSASLRGADAARDIDGFREEHEAGRRIFLALVASRERPATAPGPAALAAEVEERLISQLNMRVYEEIAHGRGLQEISSQARASAFNLAVVVVLCSVLLFAAVAAVNSWTVGRAIARRVERLADGASRIGGGDLDHRIDVEGDDELAVLSVAFNTMTARVAKARQEHEESLRAIERERAVRENAAQLRAAQRLAKVGSWFWSVGSGASSWSEELYRIVGRTPGSIPATQEEFAALLRPEDAPLLTRALDQAVETGESAELEVKLERPDGKRRSGVVCVEALRDEQGRVTALLGTVQDVTEQRLQEAQLRQSQKLEAIGRLAGGVAHDFNNLLTSILGFGGEILEKLPASDPLQEAAREVELAAQRAAGLTRQLLLFSRRQVIEPRVLDLNEIVAGMERMLRRLLGEDVELVAHTAPGIGRVKVDPGLIEQVIMNLAVNARDAMPRGGLLTIETSDVELDAEQGQSHAGIPAGRYVLLAVTDSGTGMSPEVQAHLFEPFFTTKEEGRGTGLGLSTVYGIVKQAGGHVGVYSEAGKGSAFKVYLPRTEEPIASRQAQAPGARPIQQSADMLLVEDDEQVRRVSAQALRRSGYTVIEASSGEEALRAIAGRAVDAVVTDLVMPRMGGEELAARIRADHPGTKILLVSGYTEHSGALKSALESGAAFLQKPYTPSTLAQRVRELLGPSRPG